MILYESKIVFSDFPDFTTADFDVVATFKTDSPYVNNQDKSLDITCDDTFNVAFLFEQFNTERRYDFITFRDLAINEQILRKL